METQNATQTTHDASPTAANDNAPRELARRALTDEAREDIQKHKLDYIRGVLTERDPGFYRVPERFQPRMLKLLAAVESARVEVLFERMGVRSLAGVDENENAELVCYERALSTIEVVLGDTVDVLRCKTKVTVPEMLAAGINPLTGEALAPVTPGPLFGSRKTRRRPGKR